MAMDIRFRQRAFFIAALLGIFLLSSGAFFAQRKGKATQGKTAQPKKPGKQKPGSPKPVIPTTQKPSQTNAQATTKPQLRPELIIQNGHSDNIRAIAYSFDGKLFASGGADKTIRIWDAENHRLLRLLQDSY